MLDVNTNDRSVNLEYPCTNLDVFPHRLVLFWGSLEAPSVPSQPRSTLLLRDRYAAALAYYPRRFRAVDVRAIGIGLTGLSRSSGTRAYNICRH